MKNLESYQGAEDAIRTRDPDLGKVVLYQLSYFRLYAIPFRECKYRRPLLARQKSFRFF